MIPPRTLAEGIAVTGQVQPEDLREVAARFRTLVNNRPDFEEAGQASSDELESAARRLGLDYLHIPVVPGQLGDEQVTQFAKALSDKPRPLLAFCRTGTRSASLWALSQAGTQSPAAILAAASRAGYNLDALEPRLEAKSW